MRGCAESLIQHLGDTGPILVYTTYEKRIINGLATRFPDLAPSLQALIDRLEDLHLVTKANYYHPDMLGSWSLKDVARTVAPDLQYSALEIQDGMAAGRAYCEAIQPQTDAARLAAIKAQLQTYCSYDTLAMVRLVAMFQTAGVSLRTCDLPDRPM